MERNMEVKCKLAYVGVYRVDAKNLARPYSFLRSCMIFGINSRAQLESWSAFGELIE